jgi:AcrR family transcriptional regulator
MAPRTDEQIRAVREESRGKIIDAAMELFARHGYESTSVKMIAGAAGISQGLMYNYFASKLDLLRAIFAGGMGDIQESFTFSRSGGSPDERIERLIRGSFEIVKRHRHFWRLLHTLRMQPSVMEILMADLGAWTSQILLYLTDCFRERGDARPGARARLLFAVIDGITQHYVMEPDGYPLDDVVEEAVRLWAGSRRKNKRP